MGIKFYEISDEYINFCRKFDSKVADNKADNRLMFKPYVGVVIKNGNKDYFIPITSYKEKYKNFKETLTFHFIKQGERKLAALRIGYMIPVPQCAIKSINFNEVADERYKSLLIAEWRYCKSIEKTIVRKANALYHQVVIEKKTIGGCCQFALLEQVAKQYEQQKAPTNMKKTSLSEKLSIAKKKQNKEQTV